MPLALDSIFSTGLSSLPGLVAAAAEEQVSNPILGFLPLVLIFAAMYFLLLRPQRKRQKENANLQKSVAEGDEVVLNSGIIGWVSAIEEEWLWLEIAEKVEIRIAKGSIARKISTNSKPAE
jgi:preprotein translocase subunit YajC